MERFSGRFRRSGKFCEGCLAHAKAAPLRALGDHNLRRRGEPVAEDEDDDENEDDKMRNPLQIRPMQYHFPGLARFH